MDLVNVLKAEFEQAQETYLAEWHNYDFDFVWGKYPLSPACSLGDFCSEKIAKAGVAMDAARAKYEAALALQKRAEYCDLALAASMEQVNTMRAELTAKPAPTVAPVQAGLDRETLAYVRAGWACLSEGERREQAYALLCEIVQPWHQRGRVWGRFTLPVRNSGGTGSTPYQNKQAIKSEAVTVKLGN